MKVSQFELVKQYFINNPHREIAHPEVVDWVTAEHEKLTGEKFRDPDRAIRKLAQQGFLIKVGKGIYKYDPNHVTNRVLEDFTSAQKKIILERDNYKCVICGKGREHGVELQVDHIKPKDLGGKATIENGQTLCGQHNYLKKNFNQTETGKKMFIRLYELAKEQGDDVLQKFCADILKVFEEHQINGHIEWDK